MSVIRNLTSRPVFVPLNSGVNLRLSPGKSAGDVSEVELKSNAGVEKLLGLRAIAIETGPEAAAGDAVPAVAAGDGRQSARDKTREKT